MNNLFRELDAEIAVLRASKNSIEESISTHSRASLLLEEVNNNYKKEIEKLDKFINNSQKHNKEFDDIDIHELDKQIFFELQQLESADDWVNQYIKIHKLLFEMSFKLENAELMLYELNKDGTKVEI
tara:strand:+ start:69 stop:449 length:381 start_codon:yes stop_codon:yes gene_type:complete